eukprot:6463214-Amphidinium_carterae.1
METRFIMYCDDGSFVSGGCASSCSLPSCKLVSGGVKRRRLSTMRGEQGAIPHEVLFAPPLEFADHSMHAAALHVAGLPLTHANVHQLRVSIAELLRFAHDRNALISGQTVDDWAHVAARSADEFIYLAYAPGFRASEPVDMYLAAEVLGVSIWVLDARNSPLMFSHTTPPQLALQNQDGAYVVVSTPTQVELPLACFSERPSGLPSQLLGQPRTLGMTNKLRSYIADPSFEHILECHFSHSHLARPGLHVRLLILVPSHNYVLHEQAVGVRWMTFVLNQQSIQAPVANWTAAVRVLLEVDSALDDHLTMSELTPRLDLLVYNKVLDVYKNLLMSVAIDAAQARLACQHVIGLTMAEHPNILNVLLRAYEFAVLVVETSLVARQSLLELLHSMERLRLPQSIVYFADLRAPPAHVMVPTLLLTDEQLPCVRTALWRNWNAQLREYHLYLPSVRIIHGGAQDGVRRPYPFKGVDPMQSEERRLNSGASAAQQSDACSSTPSQVLLLFHGSFAPFHHGHVACIMDSVQLMRTHGFAVRQTIVACTHDWQLRKKIGVADPFEPLVPASARIRIINAVIADSALADVRVMEEGFRSGDILSAHLAGSENMMHVHVVGSDVQMKPSPRTIVVLRTTGSSGGAGSFDSFNMSGWCVQTHALGMSSTAVRAHLVAGTIPIEYVASSLAVMRSLFPSAVFRSPSVGTEAEISAKKRQQESAIGAIGVVRSSSAAVKAPASSAPPAEVVLAKAMPVKRAAVARLTPNSASELVSA